MNELTQVQLKQSEFLKDTIQEAQNLISESQFHGKDMMRVSRVLMWLGSIEQICTKQIDNLKAGKEVNEGINQTSAIKVVE